MTIESATDYKDMQVGDKVRMPVLATWEGQNQLLFREIQDYCAPLDPRPQFQVETLRPPGKPVEYWLERTR